MLRKLIKVSLNPKVNKYSPFSSPGSSPSTRHNISPDPSDIPNKLTMTDQGDSPTEGQLPSLDTAHVKGPSLPELSVKSAHGNPVAEKLHAASLSEWDFVSKEKSEEGSAPSIRSVISISSDSCEYLGTQAATTSVVAKRKKGVMPYNNTAIPPSEEITGSTALPCMAVLLYIAQFQIN